ncbi:dual specificity tyrosine-phosphorylation-regulated kinase 2-like isoform X2 [Littorina saxatilis]|uniref:dual specificity tyrosine-phosphorylation-regulated kinase 2-like isoform X2 n=1 Tax=Littorina saxatilis TaxID=31220 RepID=UPI0038B5E40C
MLNPQTRTRRLQKALLARLSLNNLPHSNEQNQLMLFGPPVARRVRLVQRTQSFNMQQEQEQKHAKRQQPQQPGFHTAHRATHVAHKSGHHHKGCVHAALDDSSMIPPHEGTGGAAVTGKASGHNSVNIEQLFEDTYSLPPNRSPHYHYHGDQSGGSSVSLAGVQDVGVKGSKAMPASRLVAAHRRLSKTSGAVPASSASKSSVISSSSSVDPPVRRKASCIPSLRASVMSQSSASLKHGDVDGTLSRQLMSRAKSRGSSGSLVDAGLVFIPKPGQEALRENIAKLTDRERAEIKIFRMVYYLGQLSAKKMALDEGCKNDGFDDKDGFYVCKSKDHLLFRYEIMELLGKGTFGQVVKAWDHKTHSLVAMKIVKNERPFLKQAREEVRILEVLRKQDKHDSFNVVHILDSFKFRGHVCISFELMSISLHQLLKKTRGQGFSLCKIQKITRGILRCLDLLGKNHIIHCDIKPENILLKRTAPGHSATTGSNFSDHSIKVIDFGSSCYEQQQIYSYIQSRYYRAPEVIMGTRYTCAIDIWSLACVIGELYTARPLFSGDDEHDQLAAMIEVLGVPPESMINRCKRSEKFFSGTTPRYLSHPSRKMQRGLPSSITLASLFRDTEDTVFLDFMQRALIFDPALRMTASEALQHPWMLRGHGTKSASTCTRDPRTTPSLTGVGDPHKPKPVVEKSGDPELQVKGTQTLPPQSKTTKSSKTGSRASSVKTSTSRGVQCGSDNNSITAKLPSSLLRARSESASQLISRARTGPIVRLPTWTGR